MSTGGIRDSGRSVRGTHSVSKGKCVDLDYSLALGLAAAGAAIFGSMLGLGDHQAAALLLFRFLGALVGAFWVVRMLWASFRGRIHPVGGLGVATLLLVVFFPVVHPWYLLWAILPLAAWANRPIFRFATIAYSTSFSFFILPRGLGLPPETVAFIYGMSALIFAILVLGVVRYLRRRPTLRNALAFPAPRHANNDFELTG